MSDSDMTMAGLAIAVIRHMEAQGWAVVMFSPQEIKDADPHHVATAMIQAGWRAIDAGQCDGDDD